MTESTAAKPVYTVQGFRRDVMTMLRELKIHKNVGLAVRHVRSHGVPQHRQAAEFADILTLVAEERRGPLRRVCIAFVGGLTKVFHKESCMAGLRLFFTEVYEDLCTEVPGLGEMVASELMPTLQSVFTVDELAEVLPSIPCKAS